MHGEARRDAKGAGIGGRQKGVQRGVQPFIQTIGMDGQRVHPRSEAYLRVQTVCAQFIRMGAQPIVYQKGERRDIVRGARRMQDQTDTPDGFYRMTGGPSQFSAQGTEVDINSAGVILKACTPYMIEHFSARTDTVGMRREIIQQAVFQSCQMNQLTVLAHAALLAVYLNTIDDSDIHLQHRFDIFLEVFGFGRRRIALNGHSVFRDEELGEIP